MRERAEGPRRLCGVAAAAAAAALLTAAAGPSSAQTSPASGPVFGFAPLPANPNPPALGFVDEVKAGVLAHDVSFLGHHTESGADVDLEMLFTSPDLLAILGSPR